MNTLQVSSMATWVWWSSLF